MRLAILSEGIVSDRFDDAGRVYIPRSLPTRSHHFAALCRGCFVVVALGLPIGLTLIGIAPPSEEPEMIAPVVVMRPKAPHAPLSAATFPRSDAQG